MMKIYQEHLVGVFGDPVSENPTVVVQQAGFDYLGGFYIESYQQKT